MEQVVEWFSYTWPGQAPTLDAKLAAKGTKSTCTVRLVSQARVACETNFACALSRPAQWRRRLYHAAGKLDFCEQGHGRECLNLSSWMSWHLDCIRMIVAMYVHSATYFQFEFDMVGGYTDNLENHKSVKIGGWAFTRVWALAWDIMVGVFQQSQHCQHGRQNFSTNQLAIN